MPEKGQFDDFTDTNANDCDNSPMINNNLHSVLNHSGGEFSDEDGMNNPDGSFICKLNRDLSHPNFDVSFGHRSIVS
jgi:hypothetical protein